MPESVVLVTGITGYIATYVAKLFSENGYQVRGTVRSLSNLKKIQELKDVFKDHQHPIQLVEANLTEDKGWEEAMEGVTYLMHLASPFPNVAEKEVKEEDLVKPAVEGTIRVLKAASQAKIKKVVVTSSIVAVIDSKYSEDKDKIFTEDDWNDPNGPTIDLYAKSKTLAEKAAWDFVKQLPDNEKFDLSVINPSFVMGPVLLKGHQSSTSVGFISGILKREYPAHPKVSMNYCDVRDVANAHLKAITEPEAVNNRHIVFSGSYFMKDIALMLSKEFKPQGYCIATSEIPYFVVWIGSCFNSALKNGVLPLLGKQAQQVDNSRMTDVLGVAVTPIETSIIDMAYSVIDLGLVQKTNKYKKVGSKAETNLNDKKPLRREAFVN